MIKMKDLKHLIFFEKLLTEADNELVKKAKAEGQLALGYTCYFVPETLLNLPGCFSSRLRAPNSGSVDIGTYYMTNKICSYTRSILERGIEGGYNYLDALLSSETCQMMHRGHEHFEILGLVKAQNPRFMSRERADARKSYIKTLAEEYKADGVIYNQMKFCEYWSYERILGVHIVGEEFGIPCIGIEREYSLSSAGQLRTRFQAFIESIEIKEIKGGSKNG